jgi:ABC-type antimicrobial peptide transport system permease subunit
MSYSVSRRTREMGIPMALGASPLEIVRDVVGRGLLPSGAGLTAGLAGSSALTRVLKTQLFETSPTDTSTFLTVSTLLLAVSALAAYIPARRATRLDPVSALRSE